MAQATSSAEAANYLHVRNDWLARHKEEILEPDLPIIDPHHHLWDRENWRYLLDDLLADTNSGHNIVATVFVQARAMLRADGPDELKPVGEVEFVNGVAAMTASGSYGRIRACAGIVGHADMMLGSRVEPVLQALDRAGGGRFRGIRHIVAWDADPQVVNPGNPAVPGMLADGKFREGLRTLGRMGYTFDAWLYHPQLDELTALADAVPDVKIVLNHCGGVVGINAYKKDAVFPVWKKSSSPIRPPRNGSQTPGGPTSKPASRPSARRARCSRAIFRSTRAPTAIGSSGTPASFWRRARARPRRRTCSTGRQSGSIGSRELRQPEFRHAPRKRGIQYSPPH
jgi:L-fuconolactonase